MRKPTQKQIERILDSLETCVGGYPSSRSSHWARSQGFIDGLRYAERNTWPEDKAYQLGLRVGAHFRKED